MCMCVCFLELQGAWVLQVRNTVIVFLCGMKPTEELSERWLCVCFSCLVLFFFLTLRSGRLVGRVLRRAGVPPAVEGRWSLPAASHWGRHRLLQSPRWVRKQNNKRFELSREDRLLPQPGFKWVGYNPYCRLVCYEIINKSLLLRL